MIGRLRSCLLAVAGATLLFALPALAGAYTGFPLTVTDDSGTTVRLAHRPQRIVSLTLSTDEILLSLVDATRLAAVTTMAADPVLSNVVKESARVPLHLTMNAEKVISLSPDLVIVAPWSEPGEVTLLRETHIPVYMMATGTTVDEIEARIRCLAEMTDDREKGEAMIAAMQRKIDAVARKVAAVPAGQRLRVLDYASWGGAQGRGSSWDEVVRRAGLLNAAAPFTTDRMGQVPLSREQLMRIDCDIIVLSGTMFGSSGPQTERLDILTDPALRGLRAVRTHRVYTIPESLKDATSQYIADAIEWLARAAYPDLFGS